MSSPSLEPWLDISIDIPPIASIDTGLEENKGESGMTIHPSIGMLNGKVVIITGAGRGLGKAMTKTFVREGAKVFAVDFSGAENEVAAELGPSVVPFHADLAREDEIEALFAQALGTFGRIDVLVNNAATLSARRPEFTVEEYEELTIVNLRGVLLCCNHAVRAMVPAGGGVILNVSTVGSLNGDDWASIAYASGKAAVNSLTKSFAVQYGPQNIRVNTLAPGITLTERNSSAPPEVLEELRHKAAMHRAGDSEEQAQMAAFLCSDRASFVTGVLVPVDGGWSARLV